MMKTLITPRLFYKKFPFKARLTPSWAVAARELTKDEILEFTKTKRTHNRYGKWVIAHPKEVNDLHDFFQKYPKDQMKFRHEGELTIFFKDINVLYELTKQFPNIVNTFWKPANDQALDHMMENIRVEIKPRLTHDCRYKVFLGGKLSKISNENRMAFIRLYDRHPDEFVLPKSTRQDFEYPHAYIWGSPYFYVKDSKYLLMAQMLIQPIISQTVKMVTLDELTEKENADVV